MNADFPVVLDACVLANQRVTDPVAPFGGIAAALCAEMERTHSG
jgi:hypothetical protein